MIDDLRICSKAEKENKLSELGNLVKSARLEALLANKQVDVLRVQYSNVYEAFNGA